MSGRSTGLSGVGTRSSLENGEVDDMSDELGHLYLGPQSKSRYISPDFFAMISQEVRLLNSLTVGPLLTFRRLQK